MIQRVGTSYALDFIRDYVLGGIVHGKVDDTDYRDTRQRWKRTYVMVWSVDSSAADSCIPTYQLHIPEALRCARDSEHTAICS